MSYPAFYDHVPRIALVDPLAELLGASRDGVFEYRYLDAVKLAGHSCPTVAGAYLMAAKGLAMLYPDDLPERGAIHVSFSAQRGDGVTGVIANVIGQITGAAGEEGFKGLAGRFRRSGLMQFGASISGEVRLASADRAVDVWFDPEVVPFSAEAKEQMAAALRPDGTREVRKAFGAAFQDRVRQILLDRSDTPGLLTVRPV